MATIPDRPGADPGRTSANDDFGVLVGWSHTPFSRGIQLKVQSTAPGTRADSRANADIAARNYLMTKNQALILAKYLLDVTGQSLPETPREGVFKRFLRRLTGG